MPVTIGGGLSFCGREVTAENLDLIRQITRDFSKLSLTELSHTVCELLEWRRPNGGLKSRECYFFLQALHERGWLPWLSVPPKKLRPRTTLLDQQSDAQSPITGLIGDYLPVELQLLDNSADRLLFRQYIQRYHYLGYKVPYGAQLRYFVHSLQRPHPCWRAYCSPVLPGRWRHAMPTSAGVQRCARRTCRWWSTTAAF
jgi:hypothetical protein